MKTIKLLAILILSSITLLGQDIKIGFKDTIKSTILNESIKLTITLPEGYDNSDKSYPVIYRLNGDADLYIETIGTINRLAYIDEIAPEMIVVMIEPANRNRDVMPTKTSFFQSEPGAEKFKKFIEQELIPYINNSYKSTKEKLLCGQSLSSIFTLYCFLTSPDLFDSYIACSGGFPDCESYFINLTNDFLKTNLTKPTNVFVTYGVKDPLDPEGVIKKQLLDFKERIEAKENVDCELKIYEDEGHVPFQSLYHGLRFIYTLKNDK